MKARWFITAISDHLYGTGGIHSTPQCLEESGTEGNVSVLKGHLTLVGGWKLVPIGTRLILTS